MFPISDLRGRVIAFGGRVFGDGMPKYLNSPDRPLFSKARMLYALAEARQTASYSGTLVFVEGYFDAIARHQAGQATIYNEITASIIRPSILI